MPDRDGQAEQRLEHAVEGRRLPQVFAADDVGDALGRVVDDDGEVIGGGADVAAGEDDVAGFREEAWTGSRVDARVGGAGLGERKPFSRQMPWSAASMSRRIASASVRSAMRRPRQVPG